MARCVSSRICNDKCKDRWYCGKPFKPLELRRLSKEAKQKEEQLLELKLGKNK